MTSKAKQKAIRFGFVDLEGDLHPDATKDYFVKSASDISLMSIDFPKDTTEKKLDLTLISLFIANMPDFTKMNEGLLKIDINTRNPQNTNDKNKISSSIEFVVKDGTYAPGISNRGIFRNIIFRDFVNLGLSLVEIDKNFSDAYDKVKGIVNNVEGLKTLDVLNGIPYLNLATNLIDNVVSTFGENQDDQVWLNLPLLDLEPGPGAAFLRTGIYVAYQIENEDKKISVNHSDLIYSDGKVRHKDSTSGNNLMSNCLVFSVRLRSCRKENGVVV